LASGHPLAQASFLRLCCDARIETNIHDASGLLNTAGPVRPGAVVGVGRLRRSVPPWLRRLVTNRDKGCRICGRELVFVDVHHITHWAHGGASDSTNLTVACDECHRALHEGGWRLVGDADGELSLIRPDGKRIELGPPPLDPDLASRFRLHLHTDP